MNEKWIKLMEELEENGYTPYEVQRIIMYYEMTKNMDENLKKLFEEEANERIN
jgi:type II secretory pathway component PulF